METNYIDMGAKLLGKTISIIQITGILIACNLLIIHFFNIDISRWTRIVSFLILFLLFAVDKKHLNLLLITVLVFFLLRDIAVLFYEVPLFKTLSFIGSIGAYVTSIFFVMRRLNFTSLDWKFLVFIVGMVGLNIFNVYYLSDIVIPVLDNSIQLVLFFTQSAVILFFALFAYLYFEGYEGKHPLQYLFLALAFIMADLCGLIAYFFGFEPAYFFERAFYLAGLALLINFTRNYQTEKPRTNALSQITKKKDATNKEPQQSAVEAQYLEKKWFV
jgi:hypothetical protein